PRGSCPVPPPLRDSADRPSGLSWAGIREAALSEERSTARARSHVDHAEDRTTMSPNNRSELQDRPASDGWAVTSLLALLVVAFAAEYVFPRSEQRSASFSSPDPRSVPEEAGDEGGRGRLATTPSEIP